MNLLQRISLFLLKLAVHKRPQLSRTQDSISAPLGHVPYQPYKRVGGVTSQPWRPSVSARWHDESEDDDA